MNYLIKNGLPQVCWNAIAIGGVIISVSVAIKIVRSTDVSFAVANTKLEVSNQIYKASDTLASVEAVAIELQKQQERYVELKTEYDRLLAETNGTALKQLQPAIEQIEPIENLEKIATDLKVNREELSELSGKL